MDRLLWTGWGARSIRLRKMLKGDKRENRGVSDGESG
ncbi:hypothetical protein LINPERPRIM_LOCUS3936 [Linum perenne]